MRKVNKELSNSYPHYCLSFGAATPGTVKLANSAQGQVVNVERQSTHEGSTDY